MDAVIEIKDMTAEMIAEAFEIDLVEAEFMLALERGEIDGDVIAVE
jgi:hypothetical protein